MRPACKQYLQLQSPCEQHDHVRVTLLLDAAAAPTAIATATITSMTTFMTVFQSQYYSDAAVNSLLFPRRS